MREKKNKKLSKEQEGLQAKLAATKAADEAKARDAEVIVRRKAMETELKEMRLEDARSMMVECRTRQLMYLIMQQCADEIASTDERLRSEMVTRSTREVRTVLCAAVCCELCSVVCSVVCGVYCVVFLNAS